MSVTYYIMGAVFAHDLDTGYHVKATDVPSSYLRLSESLWIVPGTREAQDNLSDYADLPINLD